jgi:hypothetical protein
MHLLDGKKGILRPKKGLVFELRPQLAAFYRGPTPMEAPEEFILPSQTVEDIINKFDDIAVGYCFCRQRRSLLGDACDTSAPTLNCFTFGKSARHTAAQGFAKKVSKGAAPGICFAASIAAGLKTERSRLWI